MNQYTDIDVKSCHIQHPTFYFQFPIFRELILITQQNGTDGDFLGAGPSGKQDTHWVDYTDTPKATVNKCQVQIQHTSTTFASASSISQNETSHYF